MLSMLIMLKNNNVKCYYITNMKISFIMIHARIVALNGMK